MPFVETVTTAGKTVDQIEIPSWYKEDSSAGAMLARPANLPEGSRVFVNTKTGNVEVLIPEKGLHVVRGEGGLEVKDGGRLANLKAAEANIAEAQKAGSSVGSVGAKGAGEVVPAAPVVSSGTTRTGVVRTNAADWRALRDNWDDLGHGQILSAENRASIAKGRTPKVDDAWIKVFPEDAGLKGERIPMHHIQGSPLTVPLPDTRHLDAHMPGGFRYNPGGPGSALPAYPPKKGAE